MKNKIELSEQCDKLINQFLIRGRNFVNHTCFQYGKLNTLITGELNSQYIDDFQYFVFTKSTKSLESIRALLKIGHIEDCFILLRTMFEGYLASRFIDEKFEDELLRDFILVPQLIYMRKVIYQGGEAKQRGNNELIDFLQRNPSDLKLGKDKAYFTDFYAFLCNYAHCNYSILSCYVDEHDSFSCSQKQDEYLAKILILFVYSKIFESIVTVCGEDFKDAREEKLCYGLVIEAEGFLYGRLDELSKTDDEKKNGELNKHMKNMFKDMKKSLKEEVGSVKKDFLVPRSGGKN